MELKYILDEYDNFALFSPVNAHNDIARGFHRKPVSAGFCRIKTGGTIHNPEQYVECYGRSISLNLECRPGDGDIITKKLNDRENY